MALGVGQVGVSIVGGGIITGPGIPNILVEGQPISVIGDTVAPHGEAPHTNPTMITGSSTVKAGGRRICIEQISTATCNHPQSTGAPTVKAS
jgi:uncharacterized Zn-binding protein involved in type VI secretion